MQVRSEDIIRLDIDLKRLWMMIRLFMIIPVILLYFLPILFGLSKAIAIVMYLTQIACSVLFITGCISFMKKSICTE